MKFRYALEALAIIAIVAFSGIFLYTSSTMSGAEFTGSDNVGSRAYRRTVRYTSGKFSAADPPVGAAKRGN